MTQLHAAQKWLLGVLTGDATLVAMLDAAPDGYEASIFDAPAPQGITARKYITYQFIPGAQDVLYGDGGIAMTPLTLLVKGIVEGNKSIGAHEIADRVHTLVQGVAATQDDYYLNCFRVEPFSMPVFENKKMYRQAGGRYRILVRSTT